MGAQFVGSESSAEPVTDLATLAATPSKWAWNAAHRAPGCARDDGFLASLPGKFDEYLELEREGLTAVELDVKDENGEIGFITRSVPLAVSIGAARDYFDARDAVRKAHDRGVYMIGRIVVFEDPVLSRGGSDLATPA